MVVVIVVGSRVRVVGVAGDFVRTVVALYVSLAGEDRAVLAALDGGADVTMPVRLLEVVL